MIHELQRPGVASQHQQVGDGGLRRQSISTYPTTNGIFNTDGSVQIGGYSDPKADKLINASISGSDPAAVTTELSYLARSDLPGLFQPSRTDVYVWKTNISATRRRRSRT